MRCIEEVPDSVENVTGLKFSTGVYDGEVRHGKMHGKGKFTYSDGSVYEGSFREGKRHGKGKMTYTTGNVFVGSYKNGKRDGKGIYKIALDGTVVQENYVDGIKQARGKCIIS